MPAFLSQRTVIKRKIFCGNFAEARLQFYAIEVKQSSAEDEEKKTIDYCADRWPSLRLCGWTECNLWVHRWAAADMAVLLETWSRKEKKERVGVTRLSTASRVVNGTVCEPEGEESETHRSRPCTAGAVRGTPRRRPGPLRSLCSEETGPFQTGRGCSVEGKKSTKFW